MILRTGRRCPRRSHHHDPRGVNAYPPADNDDDDHVHGVDDTSDSESGDYTMRCLSCKEVYSARDAGTCKECYEEAGDTEEELRREIGELKSKIAFLSFLHPVRLHGESTRGGFHGDGGGNGCNQAAAYANVVLVASDEGVDSVPVPAHRAILASRSPVFKAMLENKMEESRSGIIRISEASTEALNVFVSYLYTAEVSLNEQMACELLVLAEKYQVKHLKSYCENFLISKLNWDNSVVNYTFAHQHNAKLLVDAALCLITENMDKLTKQAEYRQLVEKDARLVVDIYEAYLSKQVNTAAPKGKG